MDKEAGLADDQMARMRMIEEAVGLPKWTYSRDVKGFMNAAEEVPLQYPDIDMDWFSRKDFGFREALKRGAQAIVGQFGETGRNDVEEIVQNMGAGLSAKSLAVKDDIYGAIGRKFGKNILSGNSDPKKMLGLLYRSALQRAKDEWAQRMRRKKDREKSSPTLLRTEDQGSFVDSANSMMAENPLGVMLQLLSSPAGNKFKNWLYKTVQSKGSPMQRALLDVFIEDPGGSHGDWGKHPKIIETTQKKEPITRQMVDKHWNKLVETIQRAMKRNPNVYDWMDDYIELKALGFGGGIRASAKRIVSAQRVAAKYLELSST